MVPKRSTLISRMALLACALAIVMWSVGFVHAAAQHDAGAHVHADAAKLVNPVKSSPASIAAGKKLFETHCVSCHGTTGVGDGKMATKMTPKPSNLADASWKHGSSDGEIYTLVKDGTKDTPMKGFASKMTAQDMWSVVNYLRTLNTGK